MESLGLGEVIGIGGVAVGAGWLIWKMWADHTELTKRVINVVENDTTAKVELKSVIEANTKETRENRDVLSKLLLESVKQQSNGNTNN